LLVLHYLNWAGTPAEFKEFVSQLKSQVGKAADVSLLGIFIPTNERHYVVVWNVSMYEKVLQMYKSYSEKYGPLKLSLGKIELFHTLEEIPFL
jgi:hypothetical protein